MDAWYNGGTNTITTFDVICVGSPDNTIIYKKVTIKISELSTGV